MEAIFGKFIMSYLLLPVLSILFGGVMFFIAKKNQLLRNKKLIGYFLGALLVLVIPALTSLMDYGFIPFIYILLQVTYFIFGIFHLKVLKLLIPESQEWVNGIGAERKSYRYELILTLTLVLLGMALFSLVFNLCNNMQYGIWASTCMLPFMFISVFRKTYYSYLDIPLEIYEVWYYEEGSNLPQYNQINDSNLMVINIELTRNVRGDKELINIAVKAADVMKFGDWFYVFAQDYNKKYPARQIEFCDNSHPYGWMFYTKPSFIKQRNYIDPRITFKENQILAGGTIIAKRVRKNIAND